MSNTPESIENNPQSNPDAFRHFAFVVDGDVAHITRFRDIAQFEGQIACFLSNPTIVEITGSNRTEVNLNGWTFDGNSFIPPSE